jgi:hypothetical protein
MEAGKALALQSAFRVEKRRWKRNGYKEQNPNCNKTVGKMCL